jgi:ABC-2 type transport system permease protein
MLPPTYVFEGMRALLTAHVFRADLMAQAFAINITLIVLAIFAFLAYLRAARRHGTLLQGSE